MQWSHMFFQNWEGIVRTIIVGGLAYIALIGFLRVSGKRTLAKLNAFDLVITVALGSTLSAILLQESIALAEGAVALGLLIILQYAVTFTSVRSKGFAELIRSQPAVLARNGCYMEAAMRRERITRDEAKSAIRSAGGRDIEDVSFMVLESDGSISVAFRPGNRRMATARETSG